MLCVRQAEGADIDADYLVVWRFLQVVEYPARIEPEGG